MAPASGWSATCGLRFGLLPPRLTRVRGWHTSTICLGALEDGGGRAAKPPSRVPHPSFLITAPPSYPHFFVAAGVATLRLCVAPSKFDYDDDGDDVLRCVLAPSFTANSSACGSTVDVTVSVMFDRDDSMRMPEFIYNVRPTRYRSTLTERSADDVERSLSTSKDRGVGLVTSCCFLLLV